MKIIVPYNRERAVEYANRYAFVRNPEFFDFVNLGGNCTNFISQCLYYANGVMNPTPVMGWYFYSINNRSPSWTNVEFFYDFLTTNTFRGPFANVSSVNEMELGDIVQLKFYGYINFTHTLLITKMTGTPGNRTNRDIYITANTYDVHNKNLTGYYFKEVRFLKILGVYTER